MKKMVKEVISMMKLNCKIKIILIGILLSIVNFEHVNALELTDIVKELENGSTYYMYETMGDTKISSDSKSITIKYPSVRDDKKVTKSIKYELRNNILSNGFKGSIDNRYDVLDNGDLWTLELIDIIAKLNGNNEDEIQSITTDYLKNSNLEDKLIQVKYKEYNIIDLNGDEKTGNLMSNFQISLDYKIKSEDVLLDKPNVKLVKVNNKQVTLEVTSNLENATCDLYYAKEDTILYEKFNSIDCSKDSKSNKIIVDIDDISNYYFKSYISGYPLGSNVVNVKKEDLEKKDNYWYWLGAVLVVIVVVLIIKNKKEA